MTGMTDLHQVLGSLRPRVRTDRFVMISSPTALAVSADAQIIEDEGTTLVIAQQVADQNTIAYDSVHAWITLDVHTSLEAVGVTAAVSTALARAGIPCNVLAGFHHDHLLVPAASVDAAVEVLTGMAP
ncbi:MAG: ACT domain-containing protein [Propioniciclava sp.]